MTGAADIQRFSRIVAGVHAATGRPDAWEPLLGDVARCLDATAVTVVTDVGAARTLVATTILPEAAAVYRDYYWALDFVAGAFEDGPVGLVCDGWELAQENSGTEFYHDWQSRFDMTDGMFVRLDAAVPTSLVISAPPRREPFATAERVRFVNALVPHLTRALRTRSLLLDDDRRLLDVGAAANHVRQGIVVVGRGGRIHAANSAGERILATADGLRRRGETLEASIASANQALHAAITRALRADPPTPRVGGHLVCGRGNGRKPYVVRVAPMDSHDDPGAARAVLVVVDTEARSTAPAELLRTLFGLTPSEAAVAVRITGGDALRVIAEDLAVSVATVKTHVQHVFRKTGTHRQAELLRLLATLDE